MSHASRAPLVEAVIILDSEGVRVCAKYFGSAYEGPEQQLAFEQKLFAKTRAFDSRHEAEILLLDNSINVYKSGIDTQFYIVGSGNENELILGLVLDALYDSCSQLLRNQLERRVLMDNLELLLLTIDEIIDGGIILETNSSSIASRVLMRSTGASGGEGRGAGRKGSTDAAPIGEFTMGSALAAAKQQLRGSFFK